MARTRGKSTKGSSAFVMLYYSLQYMGTNEIEAKVKSDSLLGNGGGDKRTTVFFKQHKFVYVRCVLENIRNKNLQDPEPLFFALHGRPVTMLHVSSGLCLFHYLCIGWFLEPLVPFYRKDHKSGVLTQSIFFMHDSAGVCDMATFLVEWPCTN